MDVPDFDNLPPVEGMPAGCAWGVFDKDGKKDIFGTLNHLTPDVVKAAAAEVKDGVSISLNAPMNLLDPLSIPGRRALEHKAYQVPYGGLGWDEDVTFNTQASSQWDSLCHWQHQPSGLAYNGFKPTPEGLSGTSTAENPLPTIDHWHSRGGLVARGVLIDFESWAKEQGIEFHPLNGYAITTEEIEAVAAHQGVTFRPGDVLLLRTGFPKVLKAPVEEVLAQLGGRKISGVESSVKSARWFWNQRFAAVACDINAFEVVIVDGEKLDLVLHEHFLGLFGMSIGELWNLEQLAEYAKAHRRYSFLLTSAPLNMPCLVASPPNALAIF